MTDNQRPGDLQRRTSAPAAKLSDMRVRSAVAKEKPYKLSDGNGLYLLVNPTGSKIWRWKYRVAAPDGPIEKLMTIGSYGTVSLAEARRIRQTAAARLADGFDPMAERKSEKLARRVAVGNSFTAVTEAWWEHWQVGKSPRHAQQVMRRFRADVLPILGNYPITDIKAMTIVAVIKTIAKRGTSDLAIRAFQSISAVYRFAISHGLAELNPIASVIPSDLISSKKSKNYARVEYSELAELLHAINGYRGTATTRFAMQLLALTFVRTSELINAEWSEIDWEARRWNIPATRMKARRPHVVPLAPPALAVLQSLYVITGSGKLMFPGERDRAKPMSNNTILKALERMGYKGRMTGHGFRGIASTALHETGRFAHAYIEAQLAHSEKDEVSAAYNHAIYLIQRTEMMDFWAMLIHEKFIQYKPMMSEVA